MHKHNGSWAILPVQAARLPGGRRDGGVKGGSGVGMRGAAEAKRQLLRRGCCCGGLPNLSQDPIIGC
jgi:hypothetical protein